MDFRALGLRVGLEIHQQLATRSKLFCNCPTEAHSEGAESSFERRLRPTPSELGEVDVAAYFEWKRGRIYVYRAPEQCSCLVEADEKPPHLLNREALLVALGVAKALGAVPVDEIHVMRKIVIDGSNTTGFQRTALVAIGGSIEVGGKKIGIQTICLEEDAARKLEEGGRVAQYSLDRLGIPLVEISTAPDIETPEEAEEVALKLGQLLRLTGRVRRGIGTIRQDLNVSLRNGAKVEIKGVQELRLLSKVVRNEALRQKKLLEIREELERRGLSVNDLKYEPVDLTEALRLSGSKLVKRLLSGDGVRAFGLRLPKMRGILGVEIQPGKRFGAEVADYVRFWSGAGGLLHRDELPGYGISEEDVRRLCKALGASEEDSFVVVIDEAWRALEGLRAALERLRMAFEGVPRETRMAEPDGTTRYMRPQPGAARMYPETDVPPIVVTEELLREAEKYKPVDPGVKLRELVELYGLSWQLAEQLLLDENLQLAEELMRMFRGRVDPTLVAAMFVNTLRALRREGVPVDSLEVKHYVEALELVASGKIAKEALPMLLEALARSPGRRAEDVASELGLKALSFEELERLVDRVIEENLSLIIERGEASAKLVIGKVMTLARGRADGKIVAELVRSRIARIADSRSRAA